MSTIRELAESAYLIAAARPTSNTGIDVIEDAIQAAVNDHTRALADALAEARSILVQCHGWLNPDIGAATQVTVIRIDRALRAAGRL